MTQFYPLNVSKIEATTAEAKIISFSIPNEQRDVFRFLPGQYLTLRFTIKGQEYRRSYSICSSNTDPEILQVGVKQVKDGVVSNYINHELMQGSPVDVMPPAGLFSVETRPEQNKHYYLIAAGSGITPILSIARSILEIEKNSQVDLIYGNQNKDSIMFLSELEALQKKYLNTFSIKHYLSRPKRTFGSLFKKNKNFEYCKGRIDISAITSILKKNSKNDTSEFYLCGPGPMLQSTLKTLKALSVNENQIHTEYFTASDISKATDNEATDKDSNSGVAAQLTAELEGETIDIHIEAGQTVLQSLIDAGYNPPYSCEGGVCSTCMCKLKKGQVQMKNNMALSDDEVAKGFILSCQSLPLTTEIEVEYLE